MSDAWKLERWAKDMWWSGKTSRRRFVGFSAGAAATIGASILVPAPWQRAFAPSHPMKVGSIQSLTNVAAGKIALVGTQMAVDRINRSGGINGRMVELVIEDDESKPDVAKAKAEKLVVQDKVEAHQGGLLSSNCLACMPIFQSHKIVNMIGACTALSITTTSCSRYTFRAFDYAPAQAAAFAPYLVNKLGKSWHVLYSETVFGQTERDAYTDQIKRAGGVVVGTTGIPPQTADMAPFLSRLSGTFDGVFTTSFPRARELRAQAVEVGLSKKYKLAGDGSFMNSATLAWLGERAEGFVGINRYLPLLEGPLGTPANRAFLEEARPRLEKISPDNPLPDQIVQSNFEAMNMLRIAMQKSHFRRPEEDSAKLVDALEGLEVKEGNDFPQGDKVLRREDHQAFLREFIFGVRDRKQMILEVVPKEKTIVPAACKLG